MHSPKKFMFWPDKHAQRAKSGGQALIEEDSSVLVTLGAQDSGIPLRK